MNKNNINKNTLKVNICELLRTLRTQPMRYHLGLTVTILEESWTLHYNASTQPVVRYHVFCDLCCLEWQIVMITSLFQPYMRFPVFFLFEKSTVRSHSMIIYQHIMMAKWRWYDRQNVKVLSVHELLGPRLLVAKSSSSSTHTSKPM